MADKEVARIKKQLKRTKKPKLKSGDYLHTGATVLNCAIRGRPHGGFAKGKMYRIIGDSDSGKTFVSLTCLAEAAINPRFNDFRFIFDPAEDGAMMDFRRFFGRAVAERIEPPGYDADGGELCSETVEDFYYFLDDCRKAGKPVIYILDSQDALSSTSEDKRFDANKAISRRLKKKEAAGEQSEEKQKGSYGDGKAKHHSHNLRRLVPWLRKSGSILIMIGQAKDKISDGFFKGFGDDRVSSGGRTLKYLATCEIWTRPLGLIKTKKKVKGKERQTGKWIEAHIKKNRITGRDRKVRFPIFHSYGIDDTLACIQYLIDENHWEIKKGKGVVAPEFDFEGEIDDLIQLIESQEKVKVLRTIVGDVWDEIEQACALKRKKRYE